MQEAEARLESLGVGVADAGHDVPVAATRRQGQRPARGDADPAALGVQDVEETVQVVFVGAATVQEDDGALRIGIGGGTDEVDELGHGLLLDGR